jgi:translation initiation factor IF-1
MIVGHPQRGGELATLNAVVITALAGALFRVRFDNGHLATVCPSGKMQRSRVAVVPGDQVVCEFAVGCFSKGRIVHRFDGEGSVLKPRRPRATRAGRARFEMEMEC